jgi:hypothetical protein
MKSLWNRPGCFRLPTQTCLCPNRLRFPFSMRRRSAGRCSESLTKSPNATNKLRGALVGVQRGGVLLANRLGSLLAAIWGHPVPVGHLDINMHRDDIDRRIAPEVHPTQIPFDLNHKDRRARGRCPVQWPDNPRGPGCAERFWPAQTHPTGGPHRSRSPGTAHQGGFRRQECPHLTLRRINVELAEDAGKDERRLTKG